MSVSPKDKSHKPVMPKIEIYRDKYRIRFTYQNKQYTLNTGLTPGEDNLNIAKAITFNISTDIRLGGFDTTLDAYRQSKDKKIVKDRLSLLSLWEDFLRYKIKHIHSNTWVARYTPVDKKVKAFFNEKVKAEDVTVEQIEKFIDSQCQGCGHVTLSSYLASLSCFWNWMIENNHCSDNVIKKVKKRIRKQSTKRANPFTRMEVDKILLTFKTNEKYSHYYPLMVFLFSTGCRTGEALGLQWDKLGYGLHGDENGIPTSAYIDCSLSVSGMKDTKTGTNRTIPISSKLGELLKELKPDGVPLKELVFKSKTGKPINRHNVGSLIWNAALKDSGVSHRKWYNTRHTFISHALDQGISPMNIASITGHDVAVIYRNYAGVIRDNRMPDMF